MPTSESATTASGLAGAGHATPVARRVALGLGLFCAVIALAATVRLGLVVASTPVGDWLDEVIPLAAPQANPDPRAARIAEMAAGIVDDPTLAVARLRTCAADGPADAAPARCLAVIDDALRAAPWSGELWLARASWLLRAKDVSENLFDALRRSWRTTRLEGRVASERVILGLRLFPALPADLQEDVIADLNLILTYDFSWPLVRAYVADPLLRKAAEPAIAALPPQLLAVFVGRVRDASRDGGIPPSGPAR